MASDEVLDTPQAAAFLGLRPQRLRVLRMRGGGPIFLKIGRSVRYRLTDVESWMHARRARNTVEARGLHGCSEKFAGEEHHER